jgi:hypothetical protein
VQFRIGAILFLDRQDGIYFPESEESMSTTETISSQLLKDINLLIAAHDHLIAAKKILRQQYPNELEQITPSPSFAIWLYFRGYDTDEKVYSFIKKEWDSFAGMKDQLWVGGDTPDRTEIVLEADSLLDRIDMCIGLISQKTLVAKPVQTVRDYGWHPNQHLRKIHAFAQAASDIGVL